VKEAFESIRREISSTSVTQQFSEARTTASKSNERLRDILVLEHPEI
jgi:hypothetical protein